MERFTEHFTHRGIACTTLRALDGWGHVAEKEIVLDRLSAFEDFMEEYGFNSIDDLKEENLIKQVAELKEQVKELEEGATCYPQYSREHKIRANLENVEIPKLEQQLKEKDEETVRLNKNWATLCDWLGEMIAEYDNADIQDILEKVNEIKHYNPIWSIKSNTKQVCERIRNKCLITFMTGESATQKEECYCVPVKLLDQIEKGEEV